MTARFTGSFTQQAPIPADAVAAAVAVLQAGRLHRYNLVEDETGELAQLEAEYRDWQGGLYCLAVTSGGQTLQIALRACGLRQQLTQLDRNLEGWNARYRTVEAGLREHPRIITIPLPAEELLVGSSIQFRVPDFTASQCRAFLDSAKARGVELKWVGASEPVGVTSAHSSWPYVTAQDLPRTDRILATLFDMRLPLSLSEADCALIAELICDAASEVAP